MKHLHLHIGLLIFFLVPYSLDASTNKKRKEFIKEISKSFSMEHEGSVSLNNRHGKMEVKTWDKPRVQIEIKIIVQAKDEQRAEDVFERISIGFDNGDDFVKAITDIRNKKNSGWAWTNYGSSDRDEFEVNYEVFIPRTSTLEVKNKYGDAFVAKTDGPVHADISYGNIRFEGVNNDLKLYLGYGDATVMKAESITGEVKYSKMSLRNAEDVDLNTRYSRMYVDNVVGMRTITKYDEYNINKVGTLRTEGKYGKFNIDYIGNLIADGKYTDYVIETISESADVVLSYGGLKIESLEDGFKTIRLDGNYANFKIITAPDAAYKIEASATYGDLGLPENMETTYKRDSGYSYRIEGFVSSAETESNIKVKVNYGDIRIR